MPCNDIVKPIQVMMVTQRATIMMMTLHHTSYDMGVGVVVGVRRADAMGVVARKMRRPNHVRQRPSPMFQLKGRHLTQAASKARQPKAIEAESESPALLCRWPKMDFFHPHAMHTGVSYPYLIT